MIVPDHCEQSTWVALPTANPKPFGKKAAEAPESEQRSKSTFAPYWLVSVKVAGEHTEVPPPGQRLLTTVHVSKFEEGEILGDLTHHDDASARIRQCIAT